MHTQKDIKTLAYVLRRTNYGEADRIINLITPDGKMSVIAKGVRREKSKLAGGIEMFSLVELNIHHGKSDIGTLTGAKMLRYYNNLVSDLKKMELAAQILRKVSLIAESSDNPEYFKIVDQCLDCLNKGISIELVEGWFWLNLLKSSGEEINLYRDIDGNKLEQKNNYAWDGMAAAFVVRDNGDFDADIIKALRLTLTVDLDVVARIKNIEKITPKILWLARTVNKI